MGVPVNGAVKKIDQFSDEFTKGICDILAQTGDPGLTGSEIDGLLQMVRVTTREPGANKRDSLFLTLHNVQARQQAGNVVSAFIAKAMNPSRYVRESKRFDELRGQLNEFLVFWGRTINERGQLVGSQKATTISEAAALKGRLQTELRRRGTHGELFRYCDEELLNKSLFHANTEAAKSIPNRIREMTGLAGDGAALYDGVFGTNQVAPFLLINPHLTDSEISEHRGFKNLLLGIHGHYRNPRAHSSRIHGEESLADFYDAFGLFSYVHRRLDISGRR
jgi:uncharacterized protein (TIGR02391 family)